MAAMAAGLDTTFLVQLEVSGHPGHRRARTLLEELLTAGESLGLAPQVLSEFVHVVTDPRRFEKPLGMAQALSRAETWWLAREVVQCLPNDQTTRVFIEWMREHRLGRKRLLDTQLAATYHTNDIRSILTTNARDYRIFGCFDVISP